MQKNTGDNVFDGQSDATYMIGAGGSAGTYMAGVAHHFDDDEEDSIMVRKENNDDDDNGIHKIASGIGGFDNDLLPRGSI
jgi:hypothetical protein